MAWDPLKQKPDFKKLEPKYVFTFIGFIIFLSVIVAIFD